MSKKRYLEIGSLWVLIIFFVLSVIDTHGCKYQTNFNQDLIRTHVEKFSEDGPRSVIHTEANEKAIEYITDTLESYGLVNEDTTYQPAYMIQDLVGKRDGFQNWYLKNVIVHIPANAAKPSQEALMFMGHIDSVPMGTGASDDGVACAVMLEAIHYYLEQMENGYTLTNDLVFCFVNGEEYKLQGSKAFMADFNGFNNIVERIKFGTNLESRGTSGTLIMFETSKNNYKTMQMFSKVNQSAFTSSIATMIYDMMPNSTDFSSFKEVYQGLNLANIGGGENYHTQNDNPNNVGSTYLSQQAQTIDQLISYLGNYPLSDLHNTEEAGIFFSYLDMGTIVYTKKVAIILAIIVILMLITNILLNLFYRRENTIKQKAVTSVIALVSTLIGYSVSMVVTWGCYYLFSWLAVLFGTIDRHMVGSITYSNTAIVIGMGFVVLACSILTSYVTNKRFKVAYRDLTKVQAFIHAILGIVTSFIAVEVSYLFIFSGILLMLNELLITCVKKKDLSKLHGELVVSALYLPLIMPILFLATTALGMTMSYVYGLVFAIAIYNLGIYLTPLCKNFSMRVWLAKLNKKEIKGSPIEGSVHILAIGLMIFLVVSMIHTNANVNLQGKQNVAKLPYDDALVYVVNEDQEAEYRIYDLNAYKALKKYAPSMSYVEDYYVGKGEEKEISVKILSTATDKVLNVKRAQEGAFVYLTFTNIEGATTCTLDDGKSVQVYDLMDKEQYSLMIYTDCQITLDSGSADVEYQEVMIDYAGLIPSEYEKDEEALHFNLWLTKDYHLS